ANEVFQSFLQSQATIESSILQADTALTTGEKAIAEERAQKEAAEKEQELLRQKQKEQQQLLEAQERSHKENLEQLRTKLVQEREQLIKDHNMMLEKKLQEQKAVLEEGFKEKSEEMKGEIQQLKSVVKDMKKNSGSVIENILGAFATFHILAFSISVKECAVVLTGLPIRKEEPLEMSSNDVPVTIPMTERNPSDLPGMDTSDPNTLTGEAVLSFHDVSYRETVQSGFPFRKKISGIERLSNIRLLNVLAARKDPRGLSGDILINGKPRPAHFKCVSGYVPQNDVVMRTVTVRDNIEFSAALRLPMTVTREERRRRINEVLELLHLDKVADVKPRSKELKKRTSVAMELVAEHPILFLDDPTTGLDLRTTINVILVMKRMSMRGRTIIFSINQAQYNIFRIFDSLTLVASGKVMYHGPAQEALEYFTSAVVVTLLINMPASGLVISHWNSFGKAQHHRVLALVAEVVLSFPLV
ncbi:hypothetical protein STEG23_003154, partial [Scotinomys teguina]